VIYFQLDDDPTVPTTNYISVGLQFTDTQIYVGQIQFTKNVPIKVVNPSATMYAFVDSSSLSVTGGTFGLSNYVVKINPNTAYSYNLIASNSFFLNLKTTLYKKKLKLQRFFIVFNCWQRFILHN
jgi:hypothetical protein